MSQLPINSKDMSQTPHQVLTPVTIDGETILLTPHSEDNFVDLFESIDTKPPYGVAQGNQMHTAPMHQQTGYNVSHNSPGGMRSDIVYTISSSGNFIPVSNSILPQNTIVPLDIAHNRKVTIPRNVFQRIPGKERMLQQVITTQNNATNSMYQPSLCGPTNNG